MSSKRQSCLTGRGRSPEISKPSSRRYVQTQQPGVERENPREATQKLTLTQVIDQLRTQPDPLSQRPITYDATSIGRLVERLRDFDLTKGETIMIINLRPDNPAVLAACVEDAESRFDEEKQQEILAIIEEVLGPLPVKEAAEA